MITAYSTTVDNPVDNSGLLITMMSIMSVVGDKQLI